MGLAARGAGVSGGGGCGGGGEGEVRTARVADADLRAQPRLLQVEGVLVARPAGELRRLARARRRRRVRLARRALRLALQPALLHLHHARHRTPPHTIALHLPPIFHEGPQCYVNQFISSV